jgi:hypothetical protein
MSVLTAEFGTIDWLVEWRKRHHDGPYEPLIVSDHRWQTAKRKVEEEETTP